MITRLLIVLLLVAAFSGDQHWQVKAGNEQRSPACAEESIPSDLVITLEERGCLVKIMADGTVSFEGQAFAFDINRLRTKISLEELKKLICEFERINYFSLKDRYRDKADGCPEFGFPEVDNIILTSITLNGRSKSVTRYDYSCRDRDGFGF